MPLMYLLTEYNKLNESIGLRISIYGGKYLNGMNKK